jgi:hypothetical protein
LAVGALAGLGYWFRQRGEVNTDGYCARIHGGMG